MSVLPWVFCAASYTSGFSSIHYLSACVIRGREASERRISSFDIGNNTEHFLNFRASSGRLRGQREVDHATSGGRRDNNMFLYCAVL